MVSAAKLRRAQERVVAARPYATMLQQSAGERGCGGRRRTRKSRSIPLLAVRPEKRIQLIAGHGRSAGWPARSMRI